MRERMQRQQQQDWTNRRDVGEDLLASARVQVEYLDGY